MPISEDEGRRADTPSDVVAAVALTVVALAYRSLLPRWQAVGLVCLAAAAWVWVVTVRVA